VEACERYFEVINTLRFSDKYKGSPEGKQLELACRLNIAVCKTALGDHSAVVDQCERVLGQEPNNWKAQFRLSQALHTLLKQKGQSDSSEMRGVVDYARRASEGNPTDARIREFYIQVKAEFEGVAREETKEAVPPKKSGDEPTIVEEAKSFAYPPGPVQPQAPPFNPTPNLANMPAE
jgi:hypothetical protein